MRAEGLARVLWMVFFIALCPPFLGLADAVAAALGIPTLFLYIFSVWALLVLALAAVSRKLED